MPNLTADVYNRIVTAANDASDGIFDLDNVRTPQAGTNAPIQVQLAKGVRAGSFVGFLRRLVTACEAAKAAVPEFADQIDIDRNAIILGKGDNTNAYAPLSLIIYPRARQERASSSSVEDFLKGNKATGTYAQHATPAVPEINTAEITNTVMAQMMPMFAQMMAQAMAGTATSQEQVPAKPVVNAQ